MRLGFLLAAMLAFSLLHAQSPSYAIPDLPLGVLLNNTNLSNLPINSSALQQGISGVQGLPELPDLGSLVQMPSLPAVSPPKIVVPLSQLRDLAIIAVLLCYVFAAGKIADFLQSSRRKITKKEALFAPFAYLFVSGFGVLLYFGSGAARPPQDTLIANGFYLLFIPALIVVGLGALVLYGFFRDRLSLPQSFDLSLRIILAPIFDGLRGYWTALGAAAILVLISSFAFYSSGLQLSLVTTDFLLLSIVVSLYFLYRAATSAGNEAKASNFVTMLTILAPSLLQKFFREAVCLVLTRIPLDFFRTCPLDSVGSEVSLALSVGATLLLLLPAVPFIYAFAVNLLRAATLAELLLRREPKMAAKGEKGERK